MGTGCPVDGARNRIQVFDEKNETLPPCLGLCDRKRKTMNVAAPEVKKVLICDLEPRAHTPLQGCSCPRGWGRLSAQHPYP